MENATLQLIEIQGSVFQEITELSEAPHLPHFFLDGTAEAAWIAVLGSRKRLAELADKFRRLKIDTVIPRKTLRLLPDGQVVGLCYSTATFQAQLEHLLPAQQAERLSVLEITRSFLPALLGDQEGIWDRLQELGSQQEIQERLVSEFPAAAHAFSFGWGSETYEILAYLPVLIKAHRESTENSKLFFQTAFAITALAESLKATHVPRTMTEGLLEQDDPFMQSYAGVASLKTYYDVRAVTRGANPLFSAISLSAALASLHHEINSGCPSQLLEVLETMFTMWGPGKQTLRIAAEELVNITIRPDLNRTVERIQGIMAANGVDDNSGAFPLSLPEFTLALIPESTTATHVAILSPLWKQFEYRHGFKTLNVAIAELEALGSRVASLKREISTLTSLAAVDAKKIGEVAQSLSEESHEFTALLKQITDEISGIGNMCITVKEDWDDYCARSGDESISPLPLAHLSEEASSQDKEILAMAMDECTQLRTELEDARRQIHTLKTQAEQRATQAAVAVAKVELSPDLIRKVVQNPGGLTPGEVLKYFSAIAGDRVRVLPSAWRSAEDSKHFEYSERLLALLDKLIFSYAPDLAAGVPDSEARRHFGASYSAKESETVTLDVSMRKERTFEVDGQGRLFVRHLSVGNDTGAVRGMRVYFDILDGQVVIAYCGKHLTVASSN